MKDMGVFLLILCGVVLSAAASAQDCNHNGIADREEIANFEGLDCNKNGVLDSCEPDCDQDGVPDVCQILGGAPDLDGDAVLDACEADCDRDGRPDALEIKEGAVDCDRDGVPDLCALAPSFAMRAPDYLPARGNWTVSVVAADFDDDGHLDLASGDLDHDLLSIFPGRGGRLFRPAYPVRTFRSRGGILTGDFDGDGRPDLLFGVDNQVTLYPNRLGTFREIGAFGSFQGIQVLWAAAGDLDGDGDLDLAAPSNDGLGLLTNNGRGEFSLAASITIPRGVVRNVAGDIDGDGRTDLLVGLSDGLQALRNQGGLRLEAGEAVPITDLVTIAASDLDRDGDLDAIAAGNGSLDLTVLFYREGAFGKGAPVRLAGPTAVLAAADLDEDGDPDLAATHYDQKGDPPASISVFLNGGDGSLTPGPRFGMVHGGESLLARDLDGDGRVDLAVGASQGIQLFWSEGKGAFLDALRFPRGRLISSLAAGDLDGDGRLDLVLGEGAQALGLLFGDRKGGFEVPLAPPLLVFYPLDVAPVDLDGDGDLDLAAAGVDTRPSGWVGVSTNHGGRSFGSPPPLGAGNYASALAAADLDGDGAPDLVVTDEDTSDLRVLHNDRAAGFSLKGFPSGIKGPRTLSLGDLDGDGRIDAVTSSGFSGDVAVLRGDGVGGFGPAKVFDLPESAGRTALFDLEGDGDLDLAVPLGGYYDRLVILTNNDGGALKEWAAIVVKGRPNAVRSADLDGDGRPDLAVTGHDLGGIALLLQTARGTFGLPLYLGTGLQPNSIVAGDFDGDRLTDLAVGNYNSLDVALLLQRPLASRIPDLDGDAVPDVCRKAFRRCDANEDGRVDIADGIRTLSWLFLGDAPLACERAADCTGDGRVQLSDALANFAFQLMGGDPPPAPFPDCGPDPAGSPLPCRGEGRCR